MNIHQLLSASQSSPQAQGALSRQDSPNGFFQQALLQASDAQRFSTPILSETGASQTPSHQAQLSALGSLLSDALDMDSETLSAALDALGLDVSESDLSELLTQLQMPNSDLNLDSLPLNGAENPTPLDEISARLALMASFSDNDLQAPPIDSSALQAVSEQLNIHQTEAAKLVSALSALVGQQQGAQALANNTSRLSSSNPVAIEINALYSPNFEQPIAQSNTISSAPQISSEALMGALLTLEGASKGNPTSEHLLTGFSSSANHGPLASAPPAQGFTPTVTPTSATLLTPFTSPAWSQQLSQQLVQISQRGGEQHVQMQLNPAELGPLSISLKFGEQGAQAHFLSAHAQVRQVLEQAIPQLREALAEQGISLGETSVGEQRDPDAQAFAQSGGSRGAGVGNDNGDESLGEILTSGAESSPLILDGRVDLYA